MESNIKPDFEIIPHSDGTLEIKFRQDRLGARSGSVLGAGLGPIIFLSSCAVTLPTSLAIVRNESALMLSLILSVVLTFAVFHLMSRSRGVILVKPKQGLILGDQQLAFADIDEIGISNESVSTSNGGYNESSYVYAHSRGREVKLTKHMPEARARAIHREVQKASGVAWS